VPESEKSAAKKSLAAASYEYLFHNKKTAGEFDIFFSPICFDHFILYVIITANYCTPLAV
jgi:hypothetical protein